MTVATLVATDNRRYELVRGENAKPIRGFVSDEDGGVPLLGATVTFLMEPAPNSGLDVAALEAAGAVVNEHAVEGDPDFGLIEYLWTADDSAAPGVYRAQFLVTFGDGSSEIFPTGYIEVVVLKRVGD